MREYLLTILVTTAVTYLLVPVAARLAAWVGAIPPLRDRDVHTQPVPRLGGVAMLGGLLAGALLASHLPRMRAVFEEFSDAGALLTAGIVICLVGVVDDIWGLSALAKFAGQMLAGGVLVVMGVQLNYIQIAGVEAFVLDPTQGALLTVLLIVGTANAVNFVDGLDGLAVGVVGIGASAFFLYSYIVFHDAETRLTVPTLFMALLMGMCAGFLPHNWHTAKIFMGDSGSMLIGLLLMGGAISVTGNAGVGQAQQVTESNLLATLLPLVLPLAILALPFTDMLLAIIRRARAGRSISTPDKQHLHHRLLELGHSTGRAVFVMWAWAALVSFGVVVVALEGGWATYGVALVVMVFALAFITVRPRRRRRARRRVSA